MDIDGKGEKGRLFWRAERLGRKSWRKSQKDVVRGIKRGTERVRARGKERV